MDLYLMPIKTAILWFPIVALLFTLPYILFQYHKYGSILFFKVLITYSFIFYLIAAYFLVILPLPSIESVKASAFEEHIILEPLEELRHYIHKEQLSLFNIGQIIQILKSEEMLQLIFNILLVMPFGIYLRYYFKRSAWQTLVMSFCLSLFFEITQLSGLYGIYPAPYRYFELDDLMCNTLGGMVGYFTSPIFCYFFPSREVLEHRAIRKGMRVTLSRRIFANLIDWIIVLSIKFALEQILHIAYPNGRVAVLADLMSIMFYMILFITLTGGYTIGKKLCQLRVVNDQKGKAKVEQIILRYGLLYGAIFNAVNLVSWICHISYKWPIFLKYISGLICIGLIIIFVLFIYETILKIFGSDKPYIYAAISKTQCISTIKATQEKGENKN